MRLQEKTLRKLSKAIAQLYVPSTPDELPKLFIGTMRQLLDCEHLSYNEFGPDHFCGVLDPVIDDKLNATFAALADQHPSIRHVKETHTLDAVKISDFVSARKWKASELYNEFFRKLGIDSQLALLFPAGSIEIGFAVNRFRKDFSEDERLLLSLLQPHFLQAHENARSFERIRRASDFCSGGTVVFSDNGSVLFWSSKARKAIARFFPDITGENLPEELFCWAKHGLAATSPDVYTAGILHPLTIEGAESTLTVRLSPNFAANEHVLTIEEQPKEFPISVFTKFGHSRREAEILSWIAQGKSNPEIAIILSISSRTVAHHVERILGTIGVEGRGSAGAWAQETLHAQRLEYYARDSEAG